MNVLGVRGNSGFTLPEILVSSVIVTITALMVTQFVSQQERTQRRQLSRGSCHAYSQLVRQRLMSMGTRATIVPWSVGSDADTGGRIAAQVYGTATWGPPGLADTPPFIDPLDRWGAAALPAPWTIGGAPDSLGMSINSQNMINGTIAALTSIYRHDQTCGAGSNESCYCVNAEGLEYNYVDPAIGESLLPATFQGLTVNNRKIRIQYLAPSGVASCPQNLSLAPIATGPRQIGGTNIGISGNGRIGSLMVKVTVDYSDTQGAANRCTSTMRFGYPPDAALPFAFPGADYNNEALRLPHEQDLAGAPFFGLNEAVPADLKDIEDATLAPYSINAAIQEPVSIRSDDYIRDKNTVIETTQKATPYKESASCTEAPDAERAARFNIKFNQGNIEPGSLLVCRDASVMVKKTAVCMNSSGYLISKTGASLQSNQGGQARWMPVARDKDSPGANLLLDTNHPMVAARSAQFPGATGGSPFGSQVSPERVIWDNQYFLFNDPDPVISDTPFTYGFRLAEATYMTADTPTSPAPAQYPEAIQPYNQAYISFGQDPAVEGVDVSYGRWIPCGGETANANESVSVCGKRGTRTQTTTGGNVDILLNYTDLPEGCLAKLEWAFVDSAGNFSQTNSVEKVIRVGGCGEFCPLPSYTYSTYFTGGYFRCGGGCP